MEDEHIRRLAAERRAGFEPADRRRLVVDLGVAFVDREDEIVFARQQDRALEVVEAGAAALRIARRDEVEERRPLERRLVELVEIGQEAGRRGGVEIDRLTAGKTGAALIDN